MTWKEIYARSPAEFFAQWDVILGLVIFLFLVFILPWMWLAEWTLMQALVASMEGIIPSIAGLDSEYRALPVDASKARLSVIHGTGIVLCIVRLVTMPKPVVYKLPVNRLFFAVTSCMGLLFGPVLGVFLLEDLRIATDGDSSWTGIYNVLLHVGLWVVTIYFMSLMKAYLWEIKCRIFPR